MHVEYVQATTAWIVSVELENAPPKALRMLILWNTLVQVVQCMTRKASILQCVFKSVATVSPEIPNHDHASSTAQPEYCQACYSLDPLNCPSRSTTC